MHRESALKQTQVTPRLCRKRNLSVAQRSPSVTTKENDCIRAAYSASRTLLRREHPDTRYSLLVSIQRGASAAVPSAPYRARRRIIQSLRRLVIREGSRRDTGRLHRVISDSGPDGEMYRLAEDREIEKRVRRPSCVSREFAQPQYRSLAGSFILRQRRTLPGIKKVLVGLGSLASRECGVVRSWPASVALSQMRGSPRRRALSSDEAGA